MSKERTLRLDILTAGNKAGCTELIAPCKFVLLPDHAIATAPRQVVKRRPSAPTR